MASNNEPLIKLEPGGKAPILSYNIPEPTTYTGKNFIELDYPPTGEFFKPSALIKPPETIRPPLADLDYTTLRSAVATAMKTSFADNKLFPNVRIGAGGLRFAEKPNPGFQIATPLPFSPKLTYLDPDEAASMMRAGKRLNIYTSMFGTLTYNYISEAKDVRPRLLLVETYRLSSFLGSYGAGRIVKTFTLLPGEKTKISIRSFLKTEEERKSSSSILDSFTQESADDFEKTLAEEHSDKQTHEQSFEYYAEAEAKAGWGWGSARLKGGVKGGTNSAREEFAKNVSSSTQKHANKTSAKRDVEINTSYEVKEVAEEETSIDREIENINLSRTLNFVFRQMNQEFITLLTLVDVRVAFFNGFAETRKEVTLPELDSLLEEYIVDDKHDQVRKDIIEEILKNILDYQGNLHSDFIEERVIGGDEYNRVKMELVSVFKDPVTKTEIAVRGIILSAMTNVLRTEGVIVEALLGEGEALDSYATRLQELEVERRQAEIAREKAESERAALLNELVRDNDEERAKLLAQLTCPCGPERPALDVNIHYKGKEREIES